MNIRTLSVLLLLTVFETVKPSEKKQGSPVYLRVGNVDVEIDIKRRDVSSEDLFLRIKNGKKFNLKEAKALIQDYNALSMIEKLSSQEEPQVNAKELALSFFEQSKQDNGNLSCSSFALINSLDYEIIDQEDGTKVISKK